MYDFGSVTYQGLCASSVKQGLLEVNHIFQVCTTEPKDSSMKVDSLLFFFFFYYYYYLKEILTILVGNQKKKKFSAEHSESSSGSASCLHMYDYSG